MNFGRWTLAKWSIKFGCRQFEFRWKLGFNPSWDGKTLNKHDLDISDWNCTRYRVGNDGDESQLWFLLDKDYLFWINCFFVIRIQIFFGNTKLLVNYFIIRKKLLLRNLNVFFISIDLFLYMFIIFIVLFVIIP